MKNKPAHGIVVPLLLLVISATPSCGNDAPEKCRDMFTAICSRRVDCDVSNGISETTCEGALETFLISCDKVNGVSPTYDACMDKLETLSCTALYPNGVETFPPDCEGALSY